MNDLDNKWGWFSTEVRNHDTTWPGYAMHSSAQPKVPDALCRWAIYKVSDRLCVIALNARIFGYDRSGLALKAQSRVERVVVAMGHQPVKIPVETPARRKKHD
jgi:hypothetical protein